MRGQIINAKKVSIKAQGNEFVLVCVVPFHGLKAGEIYGELTYVSHAEAAQDASELNLILVA